MAEAGRAKSSGPDSSGLDSPYLGPVVLAVVTAYLPHLLELPVWVTLLCLASWSYLLLGVRKGWKRPSKTVRNLLALGAAGLLLLGYGGGLGLEAGVAVLAVLLALKPLELATRRDAVTTLLLTSFLIIFSLFFSQNLVSALLAILALITLGGALLRTTHEGTPVSGALGISLRLLLQGAPLALALFLVFPRFPGGLLGYSAQASLSGISDELAPGDISNLVLNEELAFRATFEGPYPPRERLYWRGLVLWDFDGRRWKAPERVPQAVFAITGSAPVRYTVMLEPHGRRWLFALDMPIAGSGWAELRLDQTLRSRFDFSRTRSYSVTSFLEYRTGKLTRFGYVRGLALPEGAAPRARALALSWRREEPGPQAVVARCMRYFAQQGFVYTLSPPAVDEAEDAIDTFLFETRKGFCGHYASAMAFMMRAAGIPARIVSGYLGGEENPVGGYLMVRQSEAHAWVEVWLEGQGWVRMDPTSVVAPERLSQGLLAALARGGGGSGGAFRDMPPWLRSISLGWDTLNYHWERTVLGYSYWDQRGFLRGVLGSLGLDRIFSGALGVVLAGFAAGLALLGMGIGALVLLRSGFIGKLFGGKRSELDRPAQLWERFCRKMARSGYPRPSWQGPMDYASGLVRDFESRRPDLCARIGRIAELYAALRFGPPQAAGERDLAELERLVREIPKRISLPGS